MATTGHESELVNVGGLKATLQQYKTSISDTKLNSSLKGAANGLAELDSNGKVPSSQLPAYVDDVIEGYLYNGKFYKESTHTTEITGEGGKIYTDLATNKTYRWSGSAFTQIKGDLVIGTTTGTAADGGTVASHTGNTTVHITAAERTAWNNKGSYSKPSGGIPKTDLAEAVQTSLGLADSALQSHQDISGKADKSATVSTVSYDTTNKKITKTINGTTTDVVTAAKIVTDGGGITSHQDISGKADKSATVSTVTYDTTNKKIRKTINGTASDVVTSATIVTDGGGIKGIIVGSGSALTPSSGNVTIPAYPTTLPASDVYDWAKAETKPTYTASEVGLGNVGNFKAVSTVASQGLSSTEKSNARANIGAGTSSFSGSYNDLTNKPTIPAAQVQTDWNATSGMGELLNKPTLGAAAAKGVTDNSSSTAVTSTDTNLITARTLYYAGYTKNDGTITGITMNGASKGTSGVVDLGTVITSHQDISGKQAKVAKLGSTTKPLYTSAAGTFAECSTYAGGTAVTLNGSSKAASTASLYAPTSAGTSGQILMSAGSGAPSWQSAASVETCQSIISELS